MNTKTLAVAALMLVTGCATGGVSLTQQDISASYSPGEFAYAGAGRDLRVVVVGNPFGGGRAAFESAVTGAMQGRHWGQAVNFTTMPGANARTSYRVVLLFGPPATLNAMRLCREEESALPTIPAADEVVLFGAFCRGGGSLTTIKGRVPGAANPQDPAFRDLVGRVTNGLFPPDRGREREGRKCPPWMKC
ncbi:MAG: hypothetical protein OEN55_02330 [Alphaproteobacteria bacterium]|nr:hypothetical protein [Alphaproteobacteria bacterium]